MVHGEHAATGSAMRRRQRRLRQWHRHERMTVAMALAEATHHAAPRGPKTARAQEEVERETYSVPRHQKTPPPGVRPAPPSEVAGPQGAAATGGYVAAGAPLLAVSSLRGADGVDDTAVKYLLRAELKKKKEEEEEEERKQELADEVLDDKLEAEVDALMAIGHLTSRQEARLSASARLQTLLPRAAVLIVDNSSVMCMPGFPGVAPRAVFFPSVVKPRMLLLDRYVPEGQLSVAFAWLVLLVMSPLRCVPFYCRQAVWCIFRTSCSRPSLCNDRCPSWSGQCSALPVEIPQAQFLDEFLSREQVEYGS